MSETVLAIAKDFAKSPGPRFEKEGPNSAEKLMNEKLLALFREILQTNGHLVIDLDGTTGYATSFLEHIFGGLAREFGKETVLKHITIKSNRVPDYADESLSYINEVTDRKSTLLSAGS